MVASSLGPIQRGLASRTPSVVASSLAGLLQLHAMFGPALSLHRRVGRAGGSGVLVALEAQLQRCASVRRATGGAHLDGDRARVRAGCGGVLRRLAADGSAAARALMEKYNVGDD